MVKTTIGKSRPASITGCFQIYYQCSGDGYCDVREAEEHYCCFESSNSFPKCTHFNACGEGKRMIIYKPGPSPYDGAPRYRSKELPVILGNGSIILDDMVVVPGPSDPDPRRVKIVEKKAAEQKKYRAQTHHTGTSTHLANALPGTVKKGRQGFELYLTGANAISKARHKKQILTQKTSDFSTNPNATGPDHHTTRASARVVAPTSSLSPNITPALNAPVRKKLSDGKKDELIQNLVEQNLDWKRRRSAPL
jgi:hypothetical protein